MSTSFILVDDGDARLKYSSGDWIPSGNSNEYNSTTHGTYNAGATMTFVFNGTMVKVYGTIIAKVGPNAPDPITTYTVDGGGRTTFAPVTLPNVQYRQLHFHSADLQPGEHTLVMESIAPDAGVWLDYLLYLPLAGDTPDGVVINETQGFSSFGGSTATTASTTASSDAVALTGSRTIPTGPPISGKTTEAQGATGTTSDSKKIIIGVTVGGTAAVLLVACLVGLLCYRKRQRRVLPPGHIQTRSMTPFIERSPTVSPVTMTKWSPVTASLLSRPEERPPAYQQ